MITVECVVNTAIVIAAETGMVKRKDPTLLECNGRYVTLKKSWAKYLLNKMNYIKQKATSKCKVDVKNFEQAKGEYLIVTRFSKTDRIVTFCISRNTKLKYSSHCGSFLLGSSYIKFTA